MIDRKKVIKAVECRRNVHKRCGNPCEQIGNCEYAAWVRDSDGEPYYPCCCDTEKLCDDILLLLKEQRTHILTIDQLEDALDTVVWLETPVSENLADGYSLIMAYNHKCGCMFFDSPFGDNPSQDRLEYSEYGKSWRCWNKRPTDEQRRMVKWK